jgi:hypothetical protein
MLTEEVMQNGYFKTRVFRVETMDRFLTIDCQAKPSSKSWVMVKHLNAGEIFIERFRCQPFTGVVRWLTNYLDQTEWRAKERARIEAAAMERGRLEPEASVLPKRTPRQKKSPRERPPFPRWLSA